MVDRTLCALAAKTRRHPVSGLDVHFAVSTIKRWSYGARRKPDPVAALRNRLRRDIGRFPSLSPVAIERLCAQYREHPGWTAPLHFDNLRVVSKDADSPLPSYPTIRRPQGAGNVPARARRATAGALATRD